MPLDLGPLSIKIFVVVRMRLSRVILLTGGRRSATALPPPLLR